VWPWPEVVQNCAHHLYHVNIFCQIDLISYYQFKRNRADTKFWSWYKMIQNDWVWPWSQKGQTCALHIVSLLLTLLPWSFNFMPLLQKIYTGHEYSYIGLYKSIIPGLGPTSIVGSPNLCSTSIRPSKYNLYFCQKV
jgi:hypothetical protein